MPVTSLVRKSHRVVMTAPSRSKVKSMTGHSDGGRWSVDVDVSSIVSVQKVLRVRCKPSTTIMEIKKKLRKTVGYPLEYQKLFVYSNIEVKNHIRIIDLDGGAFEEEEVRFEKVSLPLLTFKICPPASCSEDFGTICFYGQPPKSKQLFTLMMEAQAGLAQRLRPELQMGGSGGTYMLRNQFKDLIACFKPSDEEPRAPNNPRREYVGTFGATGLREGFKSGQGCFREVAAFLIDSVDHFHNVPHTCLCEASDDAFNYNGGKRVPKLGSFQHFIESDTCMSDYSSSNLDVDEVHKIGLLDIRIMNVDRNDGNLLVSFHSPSTRSSILSTDGEDSSSHSERRAVLIPIDHGYCLPDRFHVDPLDWCWYYWKQAKVPFSERTKKYILSINVDEDAAMLQKEVNIDLPSLRTMRISGRLMQIGVGAGLTLYEIAEMIAREDMELPSRLELSILEAVSKSRAKMMEQPLPRPPQSLAASVLNLKVDTDKPLTTSSEIVLCKDSSIDDGSGDIKWSSSSTSENSSPTSHPISLSSEGSEASREIRCVLGKMDNGIKSIDCSDEDITSIAPSTARVSPDESSLLEKEHYDVTSSHKVDTHPSSLNYGDLHEDGVWSNPAFEKDFYRNLEVILQRDVEHVIASRATHC